MDWPSFQRRAAILLLAPHTRNQVILWPGRPQSSCANLILPLCLKTLIFAPDSLAPKMSDVWFSSSLIIRSPLPTRVGMFAELVANPIPNTIAAGLPTNLATRASNSLWISRVPGKWRKAVRNWKLKDQWSVECRQNEISNVERECALYRLGLYSKCSAFDVIFRFQVLLYLLRNVEWFSRISSMFPYKTKLHCYWKLFSSF